MSYVIEDSGLSAEKEAELNAVLAPLNAELSEMEAKAAEALRLVNELDAKYAAKIKEVFEKAGAFVEAEKLEDEWSGIEYSLRDQTYDILYDWTSGRPLEFQLGSDGEVDFWEPSSC